MWFLYQIGTISALLVAGPFLLIRRGSHYLRSLPGRLGRYDGPLPEAPLWIHAVSVGEVGVADTLVRGLPRDLPLLITTITPTGQALARKLFQDRAAVAYLPFDVGLFVDKFLHRFSPRALVLIEGDLWPLLLARTKARDLPIAVVNGRISDNSYRRMTRFRSLLGPILGPVDLFGMQSEADRQRLVDLAVPADRTRVTGNLKFETPVPEPDPSLIAIIRQLAAERPVLVVGSTMSGEEKSVLAAFRGIGGGDRAMIILAPRHPERWDDVAAQVEASGFSLARRTRLESGGYSPDVLLLDSLGELAALYQVGVGCFIGGTLVPTGGHNPLEAAVHGVPISVGPSMENFRDIARTFDHEQAWKRVTGVESLADTWETWIRHPAEAAQLGQKGARIVSANRGSLATTLQMLDTVIGLPGLREHRSRDALS